MSCIGVVECFPLVHLKKGGIIQKQVGLNLYLPTVYKAVCQYVHLSVCLFICLCLSRKKKSLFTRQRGNTVKRVTRSSFKSKSRSLTKGIETRSAWTTQIAWISQRVRTTRSGWTVRSARQTDIALYMFWSGLKLTRANPGYLGEHNMQCGEESLASFNRLQFRKQKLLDNIKGTFKDAHFFTSRTNVHYCAS